MAAHHGHTELASTLMKQGVRPEEPIGEHPTRQWCSPHSHVEILRAPVHEATESGQLNVLRSEAPHTASRSRAAPTRCCTCWGLQPRAAARLRLAAACHLLPRVSGCSVCVVFVSGCSLVSVAQGVHSQQHLRHRAEGWTRPDAAQHCAAQEDPTLRRLSHRQAVVAHHAQGQGPFD